MEGRKPLADDGGDGSLSSEDDSSNGAQRTSVPDTAVIPNGGWEAYSQGLGTYFTHFNTWGIVNTFGAYQGYYESQALFASTPSNISWVGSVQSSMLMLVGVITGPLYDAGYFYVLIYSGAFLIVFGQMMLGLCTEYYQVLLAQGFCVGLGMGLVFVPGVAILSTYFSTKLPLVNGISNSASGVAGIIYTITFHHLSDTIGFHWTTRILGFMSLATLTIPCLLFRQRTKPTGQQRKMLDLPAFSERPYLIFVIGTLVVYIGINVPLFYLQTYSLRPDINSNLGYYILPIVNVGSIFGRIFPNILAGIVGPFNVISTCAVLAGVMSLALVNQSNLPGLIIVAMLYGFFSGGVVALPPICFVKLSPDRSLLGTRMGMGYAIFTIGNLVGAPIAGAIVQNLGFNAMWIFEGCVMITGGLIIAAGKLSAGYERVR